MHKSDWAPRPQEIESAPNYVIGQIRDALFEKKLKPGDRLPSEMELANLFGVSRGSIRQAMKALESLGVLSIRPGNGTYVNNNMSKNSFNPLAFALLISRPSVKTISDARYALERDIFELLLEKDERVERVLPFLKQNIEERKKLLKSNAPVNELVKNDQDFHLILSRGCENLILQIVYDYIIDAFKQYMTNTASTQTDADGNETIRDHTAIYNALLTRNFNDAKQASRNSMKACFDALPENVWPKEME